MSKDDPRVKKTLNCIDDALLKNLETTPLAKITVDTICKEADINRSTFYKYYTDKYDLLDKYINKTIKEFSEHMMPFFIDASVKEIEEPEYRDYLKKALGFLQSKRDAYVILWSACMERDVYDEMIEAEANNIFERMSDTIDETSDKYLFLKLFARTFPNNLLMCVKWWFEHDEHVSLDEFTKLIDDITKDGVFRVFRRLV